jgi:hypothetical protein
MNRKTFFLSISAVLVAPWKAMATCFEPPRLVEVFPTTPEELPGLMITDIFFPEGYIIDCQCAPGEFYWKGSMWNNYRKNKFLGHEAGKRDLVTNLIWIDPWDLYPRSAGYDGKLRFWKVVS